HRRVEISAWPQPFVVRSGDRLLLSSDGVHDVVSEQQILDAALADTPHQACQRLVVLARQQGAPDNVSVILLELPARRRPTTSVGVTREIPVIVDGEGSARDNGARAHDGGLTQ